MTDPKSVSPFMQMYLAGGVGLDVLAEDLRRRAAFMPGEYGRIRAETAQLILDEMGAYQPSQSDDLHLIRESHRLMAVIYVVDLAESEGVPDTDLADYVEKRTPEIARQVEKFWGASHRES